MAHSAEVFSTYLLCEEWSCTPHTLHKKQDSGFMSTMRVQKSKGQFIKTEATVCCKERTVWAHCIKEVWHRPHPPTRFHRKTVFVAFPELSGFEQQS